jgi:hypothetical protein
MSETQFPPELEIALFEKGASCQSIPYCRISRIEAQYQVDCGTARWVNRKYKSIIMLVTNRELKLRDRSCQMGPRIILLAAMGNDAAIALVEGWKKPASLAKAREEVIQSPEVAE